MTETKFCFRDKDRQYFRVNFIKLISRPLPPCVEVNCQEENNHKPSVPGGPRNGTAEVGCGGGRGGREAMLPFLTLDKIGPGHFQPQSFLHKAKSSKTGKLAGLTWGQGTRAFYGGGLCLTVDM